MFHSNKMIVSQIVYKWNNKSEITLNTVLAFVLNRINFYVQSGR